METMTKKTFAALLTTAGLGLAMGAPALASTHDVSGSNTVVDATYTYAAVGVSDGDGDAGFADGGCNGTCNPGCTVNPGCGK